MICFWRRLIWEICREICLANVAVAPSTINKVQMSVSALIINLPSSQPPSVEPGVLQCVSIAERMVGAQPLRTRPLGTQHLATRPLGARIQRAQPLGTQSQPLRTGPLRSQPLEPQLAGRRTLGTGPLRCWEIVQTLRKDPLPAMRGTSKVDFTVEHNVRSFRRPCCLDSLLGWKCNGFPWLAWAELLFKDSMEWTLSGGMKGFDEFIYDSLSDVPESRVCIASKNLTPFRVHWNDFLIGQIIAECHSFPKKYDML